MNMNMQQIFDMTLQHLRLQGVAATSGAPTGNACMYRAPNGDACGIGVHIAKGDYKPSFEGQVVGALPFGLKKKMFGQCYLEKGGYDTENFLSAIQSIHDQYMPSNEGGSMFIFEQHMKVLAKRFELNYTPPVEMNEATRQDARGAVHNAQKEYAYVEQSCLTVYK